MEIYIIFLTKESERRLQIDNRRIEKIVTFDQVIHKEGSKKPEPICRTTGVAAILTNPWMGRGYVQDLSPQINRISSVVW